MKFFVDARLPWGSGIGRYVASILPHMIAQRPEWTFKIAVHSSNLNNALTELAKFPNVEIIRTDIMAFSLGEQLSLFKVVGPVDLSWFTNYWVPYFWNGPYVVTVHDLLHLNKDLFPASLPKRLASRLVMNRLRARASGVIFVSDFTRGEFERLIGFARNQIVIPHGADHFQRAVAPFDKKCTALIVGAPKLHKNMSMAIKAWAAAAPPAPWRLVVVSPGGKLRSSVELGDSSVGVEFRAAISNAELENLYLEASLVLFPTKYEGFGFPILEAALSGARIICSTADAVLEIAQDMDVTALHPDDREGWVAAIKHAFTLPTVSHEDVDIATNILTAATFKWETTARQTLLFIENAYNA